MNNTVMVVDDETNIVLILKEILGDIGYKVISAPNGLYALELLKQMPKPDLFLVDLLMPVMGGRQFIEALQSVPEYSDIPVILVTGTIPNIMDFPPPGTYHDVISKPFDINEIVIKACRLLENRRMYSRSAG
ncbi:MAG TPA: response regulator [Bacillota bacterium]|nr:response regulator [Bacillota bacterium]